MTRAATFCLLILTGQAACVASESDRLGEQAAVQVERGENLYTQKCASCHDAEGGIGPRLTGKVLAGYRTIGTLFDYNRLAMPYGAPGSLSEEEYWDVLAYLLESRDLTTPTAPLNARSSELELRD